MQPGALLLVFPLAPGMRWLRVCEPSMAQAMVAILLISYCLVCGMCASISHGCTCSWCFSQEWIILPGLVCSESCDGVGAFERCWCTQSPVSV
jgi:hypothetical protein